MVTTHLEEDPKVRSTEAAAAAHEWTSNITHDAQWFTDEHGRTLLMRGVNLCGSSKLPTRPYPGSTHLYDEKLFWDHRGVSFVGRPFPLNDAPMHFARLRAWGLTLVRLLIPWESIEHANPGEYDEEYIDYLRELIGMMPAYGIKCFIDPHQDTWSRFSGGSGAPGWTFEIAGMDIRAFKETGAAYVHNTNAVPGDPLPMVWPTNYTKLASCTMFTLFFAGDTFAPKHTYQGESIQQFLTNSFINAFQHLASRLVDLEAVIGFEFMNEPHPGYIGLDTLKAFDPIVNLIFGDSPTPLQCFALGEGVPQKVGVYIKSWPFPTKKSHMRVINENKRSAWLSGTSCIWRQHGVWDINNKGKPILKNSSYFSKDPKTGNKVDFYRDFYVPFVNKYAQAIQKVNPDWFCFVEPLANEASPVYSDTDHHHNMVFAPHWYDLNCVFYKKFDGRITHDVQALQNGVNVISATYFGRNGAKKNYRGQIKNIKKSGLNNMGQKPCVLGEVGIPMDLNQRAAFMSGDYTNHIHFMDAMINALEVNLVNFTLWNYDICNDDEYGDHWNGENFSIFSPKLIAAAIASEEKKEDLASLDTDESPNTLCDDIGRLHDGGRVLKAAIRPYASKVAGTPEKSEFNIDTLEYVFAFKPFKKQEDRARTTTTELYIPHYHYGSTKANLQVDASAGTWEYNPETQSLYHRYDSSNGGEKSITIRINSAEAMKSNANNSFNCTVM
ncbi:glycoside hydrolase superfamily [Zychaea mexicana]|uniref:glycoside hydrolase superfamily n=1 Tax=Zychaea mexicana TaxID=64656 RepID=UPI0022FE2855|nr:glycoside hydrolase superfamily [Zychaea mexicana]KAI9498937.1 glycoside hydrolase superfamily [Zychaea mexicana]